MMANPGVAEIHDACARYFDPAPRSAPPSAVGGVTPKPRKLRAAHSSVVQGPGRLRRPPQRRHRTPPCLRVHQRVQRRHQPRIGYRRRLTATPRPPRPPLRKLHRPAHLRNRQAHRRPSHPGNTGHRRHPTPTPARSRSRGRSRRGARRPARPTASPGARALRTPRWRP